MWKIFNETIRGNFYKELYVKVFHNNEEAYN